MSQRGDARPAVFLCLMGYRGAERVAEALLTQADIDLLTLEPTTELLNKHGLPSVSLYAYNPEDTVDNAKAEALRRIAGINASMQNGALRSRYPFLKRETVDQLEDTVRAALERNLVAEIVAVESLYHAAQHRALRLMVVSEDHSRDMRTLMHYAQHLGIPSLQVLHGVPVGPTVPTFPTAAAYHAVYSEYLRGVFVAHGVPGERVFVTGNPAWDRLAGPVPSGATRLVYPEMGLDAARPIVTYATTSDRHWCSVDQAFPSHAEDNARAVLDAYEVLAARHSDWQFMVRPRASREDAAPYEAMVEALPAPVRERVWIDRLSPYHSLAVSDVVLCTQSNFGIEAILLGKPVINVDLEAYGAAMHRVGLGPAFDNGDAVIHVAHRDEIVPAIERALLDPESRASLQARRRRSVRRFNGVNDGRASERVADLIVRLIETEKGPVPHRPAPWGRERVEKRRRALDFNSEGEGWFAEGDSVKASSCFLKAVQEDRACAVAFNNLAVTFLAMDRPDEAWTYVTEALHLDPGLATARDNLRDIAAVLGREDEAEEMLALFEGP
ncbi:MAG: hypothetical protein R6V12_01450 [Candidatus Hydrogenedentota bacterium]